MTQSTSKITVLFDAKCRLCRRSVRYLKKLDWLSRLEYVNFHHVDVQTHIAPELTYDQLDKSMHIKLPNGSFKNGFYAFRTMMWHLPLMILFTPLLYLPGVPTLGNKLYAYVANRRKDCNHEACAL